MRVLKAVTGFNGITLQLDKAFLDGATLPGLHIYNSETEEEGAAEKEGGEVQEGVSAEDLLAANGFQMVVAQEMEEQMQGSGLADEEEHIGEEKKEAEESLEELLAKEVQELEKDWDADDFYDPKMSTHVEFDEDGDMLVQLDPQFEQPVTEKSLQYIHSKAYQALEKEGLAATPQLKGCGLMYNRSFGNCNR